MQELPELVSNKLNELRLKYPYKIQLRVIQGKFCVYKDHYEYIKETKKSKVISEYLGRIDNSGIFIEKRKKHSNQIEKAIEIINSHGGKVIMPEDLKREERHTPVLDEADKKILMALSMNARIPRKYISQMCGLSITAVTHRIRKFEKTGFIKYTINITGIEKLGFNEYFIFIKFLDDKKPSQEDMKLIFKDNPKIQLLLAITGEYDYLIYYLEESGYILSSNMYQMRNNKLLSKYNSKWYVTSIGNVYGFIPFRNLFFSVLKNKLIHKKRGNLIQTGTLTYREYVVLMELNNNSNISFTEIDLKYNLPQNSANAIYQKLVSEKNNVIEPSTININDSTIKYFGIIFCNIINRYKFEKCLNRLRKMIIKYNIYTNLLSSIVSNRIPDGIILFIPIYNNELQDFENEMKQFIHGITINSIIIKNILIGNLNIRLFDNTYSVHYTNLVKNKIIPGNLNITDYKMSNNEEFEY